MASGKSITFQRCEFHLDEISDLYERRTFLKTGKYLEWHEFHDMEKRIENHVVAVSNLGKAAVKTITDGFIHKSTGHCYAATRVLSRLSVKEPMISLVRETCGSIPEKTGAIVEGLCHEPSGSNLKSLVSDLIVTDGAGRDIAVRVTAFHRLDLAFELLDILNDSAVDGDILRESIRAIGRLKPDFGLESLVSHLHSRDEETVDAVITALTRIGENGVLNECMGFIGPGNWPRLSLGLYGHKEALKDSFFSWDEAERLTEKMKRDQILATGLVGNVESIPDLIERLEDKDVSEDAALSLYLITGEKVMVPEATPSVHFRDGAIADEWETADEHVSACIQNQAKPSGLSADSSLWKSWWSRNGHFFDTDTRYRLGKPYSPVTLVNTMASGGIPESIRDLAYEEMVIRYGIDIPFDTGMTVVEQWNSINAHKKNLEKNAGVFTDGLWYFNGNPLKKGSLGFFNE